MKAWKLICIVLLTAAPVAQATHPDECTPTSADPATVGTLDVPVDTDGDSRVERYYYEERDTPLGLPLLLAGFVLGDGTWMYEESWDLPGLQRGGIGFFGAFFPPGCDQDWTVDAPGLPSGSGPCTFVGEAAIHDETCGHSGDDIIGPGRHRLKEIVKP